MIGRPALVAQFDLAVGSRPVTLLQGLPRVGRTKLIDEWIKRRTDARRETDPAAIVAGGIVVFDQFDLANVAGLVAAVRATEVTGAQTRFMVAPIDLATTFALRDKLAGLFHAIEVAPLRLDELEDGAVPLAAAMGPVVAAAGPTAELVSVTDPRRLWVRGGLPESLYAADDQDSFTRRHQMLAPLLERDYTRWHVLPAFPLWNLFDWLARRNSNELDETVTQFGKRHELKSGIFVLEKLGLIRRLANAAISVRPDKDFKDKLFVRDTGLLHAMIGVVTTDDLEHSKAIGSSFESYAIEALLAAVGTAECRARYYRFGDGQGADEIDLILQFPTQQGRQIAIECKVGPSKSARPGFFRACGLMGITEQLVVHSGPDADRSERIPRLDLRSAIKRVAEIAVGR